MDAYTGHVHKLDFRLLRGIAVADSVIIKKENGLVDRPFMDLPKVIVTIQLEALLKGSIVTEFKLIKPKLNFIKAETNSATQLGKGVNWMQEFKTLTPLRINHLVAEDGVISYRDNTSSPKLDLFIRNINMTISNLAAVFSSQDSLLPSSLNASANSMGGELIIEAGLSTIGKSSDVDINAKFKGIKLVELNDFAKSYGGFDFEAGELNLFFELSKQDSAFKGYAKPLFTNVDIASRGTEQDEGFFRKIWEGIVGTGFEITENQPEDQSATRIPFSGTVNNPQTNTWIIVKNTLSNAFFQAFDQEINNSISIEQIDQ